MTPDIQYTRRKFQEFNALMFANRLPEPKFSLSDARSYVGQCHYAVHRQSDGSRRYSDFELRMSRSFDLPEHVVEDTIIHEMIHYFILVNGLHDSAPHGNIFKSIMLSINNSYNRRITVTHRERHDGHAAHPAAAHTVDKLRTVAVITMQSGKILFKVIPATANSIAQFAKAVANARGVTSVDYYATANAFFGQFPSSASLRCSAVEPSELQRQLTGATKLQVPNKR